MAARTPVLMCIFCHKFLFIPVEDLQQLTRVNLTNRLKYPRSARSRLSKRLVDYPYKSRSSLMKEQGQRGLARHVFGHASGTLGRYVIDKLLKHLQPTDDMGTGEGACDVSIPPSLSSFPYTIPSKCPS